jgi:hypothetical protein
METVRTDPDLSKGFGVAHTIPPAKISWYRATHRSYAETPPALLSGNRGETCPLSLPVHPYYDRSSQKGTSGRLSRAQGRDPSFPRSSLCLEVFCDPQLQERLGVGYKVVLSAVGVLMGCDLSARPLPRIILTSKLGFSARVTQTRAKPSLTLCCGLRSTYSS